MEIEFNDVSHRKFENTTIFVLFCFFSNVKLFSPLSDNPIDDREQIPVTVERNRQLIKETSSTIAVPTTFMLQILRAVSRSQNTDELSDIDDDP